ncbi:MAG: antibiotic biosynthesis monooxygenase [Oxalobacteraceae bacterium]|nr:MAG: antibiotic biosynthesis monooxygenase [Oxalobacteraceae bacterium]
MTIARHYRLDAAEGMGEELASALTALALSLDGVPGFEGADLLCGVDEPNHFTFIERWASIEAHRQGTPWLPKDAFARVMASIAGKPQVCCLNYLPLG